MNIIKGEPVMNKSDKKSSKIKPWIIILLCLSVVLVALRLSSYFRPDSYIGTAEEVKKGVIFQIIGYFPLFISLVVLTVILTVSQIKPLVRNSKLKRRLKFEREINRMREDTPSDIKLFTGTQVFIKWIGVILTAAGSIFIIANTKALLAEYSASEKDMDIFRKAGLVLDISSDLKTGETVTEKYDYIYTRKMTSEIRLKAKHSRPVSFKRSYYVLECTGKNGSKKFPISEQDNDMLSDILIYTDNIEIEYYKNSGLIKSINYNGDDNEFKYRQIGF